MSLRVISQRVMHYRAASNRFYSRLRLKIPKGNGRASIRVRSWSGFWRTGCRCGSVCNCTSSFGILPQRVFETEEVKDTERWKSRQERIRERLWCFLAAEWTRAYALLLRANAIALQTSRCCTPARGSVLRNAHGGRLNTFRLFT